MENVRLIGAMEPLLISVDRIIRVNKFTLFGYEKYVGSRVDIYCAKWHKIVYRIHDHNEFWFPHPKPPTMWHALGGKKRDNRAGTIKVT